VTFREYLGELVYPIKNASTVISLLTFWLFLLLIVLAGFIGTWLALAVVPALCRYLILLAQARARGRDADPPGIEYFSLAGNLWTLFPVLPLFLGLRAIIWLNVNFGPGAGLLFVLAAAVLFPAMMAVLVITHSPVQSLNPLAIVTLLRESGPAFWYAPLTFILLCLVGSLDVLPGFADLLLILYLVFAFYAVVGASIRSKKLIEEVYIPEALDPDPGKAEAATLKERTEVLNHAYALVSRGNRDGGFSHIIDSIASDADPGAAWDWFFDEMLKWERKEPALFFAQLYLPRLLVAGEARKASKLIVRCRYLNDSFRPATEDLPAAIEAAESCGNKELRDTLKRL
jgi:hypothetical protein